MTVEFSVDASCVAESHARMSTATFIFAALSAVWVLIQIVEYFATQEKRAMWSKGFDRIMTSALVRFLNFLGTVVLGTVAARSVAIWVESQIPDGTTQALAVNIVAVVYIGFMVIYALDQKKKPLRSN
jgi:uncharacterized membrane protein